MKDSVTVNIAIASSARGLRDELQLEARKRGRTFTKFVGAIYEYAIAHREEFSASLAKAREKPGDHIGASVSATVSKALTDWAIDNDTSRAHLCCFILEKCAESSMYDQIFNKGKR